MSRIMADALTAKGSTSNSPRKLPGIPQSGVGKLHIIKTRIYPIEMKSKSSG